MLSKLITFNESTLIPPKLLAQEISKYQILWSEILNSMYIYIYKYSIALESEVEANMFLVDGSTLKAKLLRICEIIVDLYVHAVYDYILRINMGLFSDASRITDALNSKVEDTLKLVELEAIIDQVLKVEIFRL